MPTLAARLATSTFSVSWLSSPSSIPMAVLPLTMRTRQPQPGSTSRNHWFGRGCYGTRRLSEASGEWAMEPLATNFFAARLPLLGLVIFALLSGFAWFGGWLRRRHPEGDAGSQSESHLLSANLALLGLLIGFTFSLALTRYDVRRTMVV